MKPLTSKEDILRYMRNNPGIRFDAESLANHFICGIGTIRTLLNSLAESNVVHSNRKVKMVTALKFWVDELQVDAEKVEQKPIKPLQMTLAKRIALERCAELYPADRHHFECVSKIPGNPSLKGDE